MYIKQLLTEAQADWAAMPYVENDKLEKLKNKTFVVYGQNLARCFCYALLFLNETKKLRTKVIFAAPDKTSMENFYSELLLRDDFDFCSFSLLDEIKQADYILYGGLCSEKIPVNSDVFKKEIAAVKEISHLAKRTGAKTVLLSDSRVYANTKPYRVYSENEYAFFAPNDLNGFSSQLFATVENMFNCFAQSDKTSLTVLRTGVVLGADSGIETDFDYIFDAVASGKKCSVTNDCKKYSFAYISDVFKAIIHSFVDIEGGKCFNVASQNAVASAGMLATILNDIYNAQIEITSDSDGNTDFCAMNSNKITEYGCSPSITLETSLELCVISRMRNKKATRLPHTHDGRLTSIQQVLLAYLLEVDRICKKYNIKYFLGGGTLLGAIRHHGFIPWDDDADIMMLREDYDKFCKIAPSEMPASMTFQTNENDKNCFYEFAKFRLNDTVFATGFSKEHKSMHNGLAFDIFCHDKTANSRWGRKLHLAMTLFTRALVFNKWNNRKAENGNKIQSVLTNFCKAVFPIRLSLWLERKTLTFFKNKKNAKYLYDGMGRNIYNGSFPIEYLDEVIYVDFEGCKLPVPKEYDKYLTFLYGDYMELAPLSTRLGCHDIKLCDIGKYDGFKLYKSAKGDLNRT